VEVLPPVGTPELSVAERLRANFEKAQARKTQEFEFPTIEGLYIVFRPINDFAEAQAAIGGVDDRLTEAQKEIELALQMLVASSIDSYAMVDGKRFDIGLSLGVGLYDYLFPSENGEVRPTTDAEAVSLMFGQDTLGLVMYSRKLSVMRKMASALVEAEPGKS
jgi:hypothetical protein